jgi:hypothetical protein
MIRVYRVRRYDGAGPYRVSIGFQEKWANTWHGKAKHRPTPYQDPWLIRDPKGHVCGFTTVKAVYRWFGRSNLRRLYDLGFRIETALVENHMVGRGKFQCLIEDHPALSWHYIEVGQKTKRGAWRYGPIRPDSF